MILSPLAAVRSGRRELRLLNERGNRVREPQQQRFHYRIVIHQQVPLSYQPSLLSLRDCNRCRLPAASRHAGELTIAAAALPHLVRVRPPDQSRSVLCGGEHRDQRVGPAARRSVRRAGRPAKHKLEFKPSCYGRCGHQEHWRRVARSPCGRPGALGESASLASRGPTRVGGGSAEVGGGHGGDGRPRRPRPSQQPHRGSSRRRPARLLSNAPGWSTAESGGHGASALRGRESDGATDASAARPRHHRCPDSNLGSAGVRAFCWSAFGILRRQH